MRSGNLFLAVLFASSGLAVAQEDSFSLAEAVARDNLMTREGAAYDRALAEAFQSSADFETRLNKCLEANPGPQAIHGYFRFTSATEYQVELRPVDRFSSCVEDALEGFRVPPPPAIPYLNHFTFTVVPEGGSH